MVEGSESIQPQEGQNAVVSPTAEKSVAVVFLYIINEEHSYVNTDSIGILEALGNHLHVLVPKYNDLPCSELMSFSLCRTVRSSSQSPITIKFNIANAPALVLST